MTRDFNATQQTEHPTFVLGGELPHRGRQALVELMLAGNEGLTDGLLPEAQDAGMAPHLVHKGLEHHPFLHVALMLLLQLLLPPVCLHGRTHPPLALATPPRASASSQTHTTLWDPHPYQADQQSR